MGEAIVAAILAGGKSRRMGFDKAEAPIGDATFLAHAVRSVQEAGLSALVVGRAKPAGWDAEDVLFLQDQWPDLGPMGGLATALRQTGGAVLALACDTPKLTSRAICWLLHEARIRPLIHGLVTVNSGQYEPLFAVYTQESLPLMEDRLAARDLSMQGCIRSGQFALTHAPDWVAEQLMNINTPEDMAALTGRDEPMGREAASSSGPGIRRVPMQRILGSRSVSEEDVLAVEEPLEIRVGFEEHGRRVHRSLSITMRTPGQDCELAAGFLFTEGIVQRAEQIAKIAPCGRQVGDPPLCNTVRVDLAQGVGVDLARLSRHFYTSSSCGVCGKASIDALRTQTVFPLIEGWPVVKARVIHGLPQALRQAQEIFEHTGGLHASALFSPDGNLLDLCEDVGRHNALDKLIGRQFLAGGVPLSESVLLVSGRSSFELMQKALMAGIPILAAVGAPSSLAVELANEAGATLLGFVREDRFNIYAGPGRISQ